jgi:hypothetical protein
MKFIPQAQLDKTAWNKFVSNNCSNHFSHSWYLDACAADWCVLIDDDWKNGIALPFACNLGIENITPVIFGRTLDFIGDDTNFQSKALEEIQKRFKIGRLQTEKKIDLHEAKPPVKIVVTEKVHQIIDFEIILGSQAKRMLKKAAKSELIIQETNDWEGIIAIAETELSAKISEFNEANLKRLRNLTKALSDSNQLLCMGIYEGEILSGGMVFAIAPSVNLYLKGAALPEAKKNGGMYLCMHTFIQKTLAENKVFDFGGSSVEGVQRFNYNLGGKDNSYYIYEWDCAPWWYHFSKKMYHFIKRK